MLLIRTTQERGQYWGYASKPNRLPVPKWLMNQSIGTVAQFDAQQCFSTKKAYEMRMTVASQRLSDDFLTSVASLFRKTNTELSSLRIFRFSIRGL